MTNAGFLLQPGDNGIDPDWSKSRDADDAGDYLTDTASHVGDEINTYMSEMSSHPAGQRAMKAASQIVLKSRC